MNAAFVNGMFESIAKIHSLTTYCGQFVQEALPRETEQFKREDLHYEADGMRAAYRCSIDGRLYDVKITVRKE